VNITAAIAVKKIMERERIPGTIHIWPGVAEEQLGSKAYLVREGVFKDVDAVLFSHVSDDLNVSWGAGADSRSSAPRSHSRAKRACGGRSVARSQRLDAVEIMDVAWNFRREHLRTQQRSHYVITTAATSRTSPHPPRRFGTTSARRPTRV